MFRFGLLDSNLTTEKFRVAASQVMGIKKDNLKYEKSTEGLDFILDMNVAAFDTKTS